MMKKFLGICSMLILLGLLAACGPGLTKGYVMGKHDVPAHTYTHWHHVSHCITIKKKRHCTTSSYSTLDHVPEEWIITLSSCNPDTKRRDDCQQGSVHVSNETFDGLQIGEYVDLTNTSDY